MSLKNLFFLLFVIIIKESLFSQEIIPDYRRVDWTGAGCENDIPCISNIVDATTLGFIGDSITDNSVVFALAVTKLTMPCVVYFPEGKYLFHSKLSMKDGLVLRGASPAKTRFYFDQLGKNEKTIEFYKSQSNPFVDAIDGYVKGSVKVTVADAKTFKAGGYFEIQQANDSVLMYTSTEWMGQTYSVNAVGQLAKIIAVDGNIITIDRPLRITFRKELTVQCKAVKMIINAGIENLFITRLDSVMTEFIYHYYANNCWVRNIESTMAFRSHVQYSHCLNCVIRDSYFHHAWAYGGGGQGYGVCIVYHSGDILIENNIFNHLRHAMIIATGSNGNVFAYNYSFDPYCTDFSGIPPDISLHGFYPFENLFEGNIVSEVGNADHWGPSGPGNTFLRNRVYNSNFYIYDKTADQNIIGNELTAGINKIDTTHNTTVPALTSNTIVHGNNENGRIYWMPGLPQTIPYSYYLTQKPAFFGDMKWPSIGQGNNLGYGTIPAKRRFELMHYIKPYDCTKLFNVEGKIKYNNTQNTVLKNVKVFIKDQFEDMVIDSTTSDTAGYYQFRGIAQGEYLITAYNNSTVEAVDPLDALIVNRYYIGMFDFPDSLSQLAADVNNDSEVNPADALFINRRYIGSIQKFPISDWLFEQKTINIDNTDIIQNLKAICTGDVDVSFQP